MLRAGRPILFASVLLISFAVFNPAVFGQGSTAGNEGAALTGENQGGTLPPEFPTRETFRPEGQPETVGVDAWTYVRFFVALALVLLIIWGLSFLMKKILVARGLATTTECLKVLYVQSLTPSRSLYLVRLVDRILLIGAGEGGLRTLTEITDPAEVSAVLKELEFKGDFDLNPFRDKLKTLISSEVPDEALGKEDLDTRQRKMKGTLDRLKNIGGPRKE
jgi:flagellar biogenesis protein FliO